jgi:hypothetical protein
MPDPRRNDQSSRDPGAFIGRMPERATETIPGGIGRRDRRVSGVASQPAPVRGPAPEVTRGDTPGGHREGDQGEDVRREAGENH